MANKDSGWKCTHDAYVSSQNDSSANITVKCYFQNDGWNYQIGWLNAWTTCNGNTQQVAWNAAIDTTSSNYASAYLGEYTYGISKGTSSQSIACSASITSNGTYIQGTKSSSQTHVSVSALPSYTVSYNANGGSGAPGSQTKWYGRTLTLSSSKPSRSGHDFSGWNTNSSGTGTNYSSGGSYTANAGATLYAKWTAHTYTVSYNANGGSGAPGNQTKTYGQNLTLSSTKPTRTNYNFKGWSTSASGGVVYASGATYTNNSAVTLYAVWELAYVRPKINNFNAYRCTSNGTSSETGTYLRVKFDWSTFRTCTQVNIDWKIQTASDWTIYIVSDGGGTSGSVDKIIGDGQLDTETSYYVRGFIEDDMGYVLSDETSIGTIKFPIDVKKGGNGVAVGKVAEEDKFDVGMQSRFREFVKLDSNAEISGDINLGGGISVGGDLWKNGGRYTGYGGSCGNANDCKTHGYYLTNHNSSNLPGSNLYGVLEVIECMSNTWVPSNQGSWAWQIFRNTGGEEYHRYGVNSNDWSAWTKRHIDYTYNDPYKITEQTATYTKYANGLLVQHFMFTINASISNAWGPGYEVQVTGGQFPITFKKIYSCNVVSRGRACFIEFVRNDGSSELTHAINKGFIWRPVSDNGATYTYDFYCTAYGTWK